MTNKIVTIDYTRDNLFDELGVKRLKESYMTDEECSPQDRFAFVSQQFSSNPEHAQRLYDYASKHWLSYSTPILSFAGRKRQLPISCYLPYLADTAEGLVDTLSEVNWLSMLGGGVGIGIGIRSTDNKSVGIMPHLRTYDASCLAYRQGQTRRGSYATYLDISHPDILMFLEMRKPTGDPNMRCQNLHHGINISDAFMEIIEKCMIDPKASDEWELKDPHSGVVREVVSAKDLWQRILEIRMQTGEPYLHFIDTSNQHLPEWQKKLGLSVKQSNLCLSGEMMIQVSFDPHGKDYDTVRIDHFVEKWNFGYYNECYVRSMKDGNVVWSPVLNAGQTGNVEELIEIELPSGKILRCTENHKIYTTNRGWVEAKDLLETDNLKECL